uniref:LAGLIDADG endonuclease n=1 Tax=Inonotus hispidus TaxID=40469 RepID=UPI002181FEF7|nr:LAGLIDADG endonuclease [Inonotus hispidus]UVF37950.1 LAGLIDADG endonuclease [Inonotus hispidus]
MFTSSFQNLSNSEVSKFKSSNKNCFVTLDKKDNITCNNDILGSYLAGLIEGGGTFAVHNKESLAKKYYPMIIVVFKKNDLPLAQFLQNITECGNIYIKSDRGYVLWQIQDIVSAFTVVKLINGKMRTPKIEALKRTIDWLNKYIELNKLSNFPKTNLILSKIHQIELKSLDRSPIESNSWLSGFTDAEGNFSINIHKRTNNKSTRVQLYYRLEIRQTYHRLDSEENKTSFFSIMSVLAKFLNVNVYSRSRCLNNKQFYSYTIVAQNKNSLKIIVNYFLNYPLLSSKILDFKNWLYILEQKNEISQHLNNQRLPNSFLDEATKIRKDFNKTRTTYNWDHLKNCYLIKID